MRHTYTVVCLAFLLLLSSVAAGQQFVIENSGDGSQYELAMPNNWNGILVVWAHGISDPQAPIALPDIDSIRDALLADGYAMAYSSYSSNGYAVKDAMQRTHQLRGLFIAHFSRPRRTILMGRSLGSLAIIGLAETYPGQYDGALPMCGILGGSQPEVDYVANGRVLYDFFFSSGAFGTFYQLPGNAANPVLLDFSPGSPAYDGLLANFVSGLTPPYYPTLQFAATAGIPINLGDPNEVVSAEMTVMGFFVRYGSDLFDRTHNHYPSDNLQTVYSDPLAPSLNPLINAGVERYGETPDAFNYLNHAYTPTGKLSIPVVTIHTTRDPIVPVWHEDMYLARATQNGGAKFLVQTKINRYGHCTFTDQEILDAFTKLVTWVETGTKPAP